MGSLVHWPLLLTSGLRQANLEPRVQLRVQDLRKSCRSYNRGRPGVKSSVAVAQLSASPPQPSTLLSTSISVCSLNI